MRAGHARSTELARGELTRLGLLRPFAQTEGDFAMERAEGPHALDVGNGSTISASVALGLVQLPAMTI